MFFEAFAAITNLWAVPLLNDAVFQCMNKVVSEYALVRVPPTGLFDFVVECWYGSLISFSRQIDHPFNLKYLAGIRRLAG